MNNISIKFNKYFLVLFVFLQLSFSQSNEYNCFSIIVGKNASIDGSVLFAHNEDDSGINLVNWYKVPRLTHQESENISLINGGQIPQVNETYSFLWFEMPGLTFSDLYLNEWGITIASNACQSKEETPDLIDGGIGYYLRRIMAERARTAKEAVNIAGSIVDSIGYASSGRTYCIADPNESWMMSIVHGKHWVAEKIPDDHISIIPNYYTIQDVDLTDSLNFLGSTDIIDYAIKRGWYDPESGEEFNFRLAYGKPSWINHIRNKARNWGAINLLSSVVYEISDDFPFSFIPKEKVSIQDLMDVLKYHYENTELEDRSIRSPHDYEALPICRKDTQYGMIAQLRSWLPSEIGNVMWLAPYRPCSQVFIPWYFGISKISSNFAIGDYKSALKNHFIKYDDIKTKTSTHNFWKYVDYTDNINDRYYELMPKAIEKKESTQKEIFKTFNEFDRNIQKQYKRNQTRAIKNIDFFMKDMIEISFDYLEQ